MVDQITQAATINEQEGYVQGVDQAQVEATLANYQQQIEDYINSQNPDATVGDVLGTQKVIVQEFQTLAAGLPYQLVVRTNNYSTLPGNLRHKFRYTIGTEFYGQEDRRLITFEQSLPELAGKKHFLSFRPTSQADEDFINSYLPEPDPATGEIDPNQLPNSLPGYLINLTAEFTQDDEVLHSASAGTMGGELYETLALWSPSFGWEQAVNHPVVGEYRAIGLDLQGVNNHEAENLQSKINSTRDVIINGDESQINALTKNEVIGNMLYSTIYSYMVLNDVLDNIQSRASDIINYRLPSFGVFGVGLQTNYWFGLPRNVDLSGLVIDVDRLATQAVAKSNDKDQRINFVLASGTRASAMEHYIPELLYSTPDNQGEGISAVKALNIAMSEGQKIWTVDMNNLELALSSINLSAEIENDIRNAVLAGKVATAHEQPVNFAGGTNTGYILTDPKTGSGAYLISTGESGGYFVALFITAFALFIGLSALLITGPVWAGALLVLWELINLFMWADAIRGSNNSSQFNQANFAQAVVGALGLLLIPGLGGLALVTILFGMGFSWMLTSAF